MEMKNLLLLLCALTIIGNASAQVVVNDDINRTETPSKDVSHGKDAETNYLNSGVNVDWYNLDHGFGLGYDMIFNSIIITGSFGNGETNDDITANDRWTIGAGGHYRYWFGKNVYAEGSAGIEYIHSSVEYKVETGETQYQIGNNTYTHPTYGTQKDSNGDFGMFIAPRFGICLGKVFGSVMSITAGYRWDCAKFKFTKEYTSDCFTLGVGFVM
jgi:hypothetical protein